MDLIGFVRNLSNDAYHSGPGVSRSFLWTLLDQSPAHAKIEKEETEAMRLGTAFHCAVLEPDRFDKEYRITPDDCRVGSGKGQRERLAAFREELKNNNQTEIKPEDLASIRQMAKAIREHPDAGPLLKGTEREISGYWYDPDEKDILCKIRPDGIQTETGIIIDLKKEGKDARERAFTNKAHSLGYHMSAFMTLYGMTHITGVTHSDYRFIVVEDHEPWQVVVYRASKALLHIGGFDLGRAFRQYVECFRTNTWPGYPSGLVDLNPPGWRLRAEMMQEIIE